MTDEKLAKIKELEDYFGISAVILLTALKDGVWKLDCGQRLVHIDGSKLHPEQGRFLYGWKLDPCFLYYFQYGKMWALTKEELK